MRVWLVAFFTLMSSVVCANTLLDIEKTGFFLPAISGSSGGGGNVTFTALHTYYMSPTTSPPSGWSSGSDSNNGLSQSTPWATPNHAIVCGDVIIAAPGSYANLQSWGAVSSCPSTTGGIQPANSGGVYFATVLCGGTYVGACTIQAKAVTTGNEVGMDVSASNWAVEGWYVNTGANNPPNGAPGYVADGGNGVVHHIAFINDISVNNNSASYTNDSGKAGGQNTYGADYYAVVGMIAQNSVGDSCVAAIDVVGPGVYNNNAGTHYYVYGNFSYANHDVTCETISDSEDYMGDTLDYHDVQTPVVFANNIGYDADRMCIQAIYKATYTAALTMSIYNNTCYRNNVYNNSCCDNLNGEVNINDNSHAIPWTMNIINNLAYQPCATSCNGTGSPAVAAYAWYNSQVPTGTITIGGTGNQNFWRANNTSCKLAYCNSTYDAQSDISVAQLGTNTYTNPAYTNTTDLLANQVGPPSCGSFINTTLCMGWNANTNTLTTPSVISDLIPTASGTTGKGYQLPSTTCASNADYPTWLKGIVYLQWNSGTGVITENPDLVTKPCNL